MSISKLGQHSRQISYGLFPVVVVLFFAFTAVAISRKEQIYHTPMLAVIATALLWQIFTVCNHIRSFVSWILLLLYCIASITFFWSAMD